MDKTINLKDCWIFNEQHPKVSIVVPVFNVEQYICRCLNSICRQTFNNFEVILVDDGSTDKSSIICDQYVLKDKRFRVLHTENKGLSAARNTGISVSIGEFIIFIDSDDYVSDDLIEHMISVQQSTDADIVSVSHITTYRNIEYTQKEIKLILKKFSLNEALKFYIYSLIAYKNDESSAWGKLFRKNIFSDIRFPIGRRYEDMVTIFQAIMKTKIYIKSNKVCYYYCMNPSSIVRSVFIKKDFDLLIEAKRLYNIATQYGDNYLVKLARIKKHRCCFTLLGKIALYGIDKDLSEKKVTQGLLNILRINYIEQLTSSMSISRKIILTLMCINWPLAKKCINILKKILKK